MQLITKSALLVSAVTAGLFAASCSEEKFQETPDRNELYARAFIKDFGTPDPDHDWSMATTAGLRVNAPEPVRLQVFADIEGQRYIFADIAEFKGDNPVPVTIPKHIDELIVVANDVEYRCAPSATLDLSTARSSDASRSNYVVNVKDERYKTTISVDYDSKTRTMMNFEIDDNPEIKTILTKPFESKYLRTESDQGIPFGPFFGNGPYTLTYGEDNNWPKDWELYPLSIKTSVPEVVIGIATGSSTNSRCYNRYDLPGQKSYTDANHVPFPYGINSFNRVNNEFEYSSWYTDSELEKRKIVCEGFKIKYTNAGLYSGRAPEFSYYFKRTYSRSSYDKDNEASAYAISYSFAPYNYYQPDESITNGTIKGWGNNFYDARFKDMNTCYSTCLFFKNVPIKWRHNGTLTTDLVQIFALYDAPTSPAQARPERPAVYLLEYHNDVVGYEMEPYTKKKYYPYSWRVFAEDLGGSHDWDFNDLVFDVSDVLVGRDISDVISTDGDDYGTIDYPYSTLIPKGLGRGLETVREVTVTPRAAGGTLPIYLGWKGKTTTALKVDGNILISDVLKNGYATPVEREGDFIIGTEMHKWLNGNSYSTPLNVGDKVTHFGKPVKFYIPNDEEWYIKESYYPKTLLGFYAVVDPDRTLPVNPDDNFDAFSDKSGLTPFDLNSWKSGYTVKFPDSEDRSKTPQMFVAYNVSWTKESMNFGMAYPGFHEYVKDHNIHPITFFGNSNQDMLVPNP